MRTLIETVAGRDTLANAVVYGTDAFGATILRPAIAMVDDRTLTQLLGHIHRSRSAQLTPCLSVSSASEKDGWGRGHGSSGRSGDGPGRPSRGSPAMAGRAVRRPRSSLLDSDRSVVHRQPVRGQ